MSIFLPNMEAVQASNTAESRTSVAATSIMKGNDQATPVLGIAHETDFHIEDLELVSKQIQYFLITLYSLTAAVALLGNVLAIVVLTRGKRTSRNLSKYLINLSLSDILMSVFSIPFTYTSFIMGRWIFPPETCPLVQSIQVWSVFVSIYTLTIIGIDRYIAITRPFVKNIWSKSFAPIVVALTWLVGFMLSLVIWFCSEAVPLITIENATTNVTYYECREIWRSPQDEQLYTVTLFLVVFAIPLISLIFVYGSITVQLWSHSAPGNRDAARDGAQSKAKRKVINMLITCCVLFAFCWFPTHLFQLIRAFNKDLLMNFINNDASSPRYLTIVIVSHWLAMSNSFVNPIIYCFMSDNFRTDLKSMFKRCLCRPTWCRTANIASPRLLLNRIVLPQANDETANNQTRIAVKEQWFPLMPHEPQISIEHTELAKNGIKSKFNARTPSGQKTKKTENNLSKAKHHWASSSRSSSNSSQSNSTVNSYSPSVSGLQQTEQATGQGEQWIDATSIAETKT